MKDNAIEVPKSGEMKFKFKAPVKAEFDEEKCKLDGEELKKSIDEYARGH